MNLATILILLPLAAFVGLAIRYLTKNGMCAACENKGACRAAKKPDRSGLPSGCGGQCASCRYFEAEQRTAAAAHRAGL